MSSNGMLDPSNAPGPAQLRIGVDIGGTFTDLVILDETTGELRNFKGLSTPHDFAQGVLDLVARTGVEPERISFIAHGTTVGINAVLQRAGPPTGIVTTAGFEDVLELRRSARTHVLDPFMEKPWMFVPRRRRVGVMERVLADGSVATPLDPESALAALAYLVGEGVESIAICLLNAYANPAHESVLKALVTRNFPELYCCISSDTVREIKEYERTSTTALNAYLLPVFEGYLKSLSGGLNRHGIRTDFHIMQSSGQLMSRAECESRPIHTLESGPAGGAIAASHIAALLGFSDALTFDMGGTTCKSAVIEGGEPRTTLTFELLEETNKPGSGWPIRVPMIDILEVPIAGGSLCWVDDGGTLHVGPRSAGADPGPVCYDRGGEYPTITDADVVTGRVEGPLAGGLLLNVEKARSAIMRWVAGPLGLSLEQAAAGILEIADARAADVVRQLTVVRGRDPRDCVLLAFGGSGPLHAAQVLYEMSMPEAVIPPVAGNFSAFGLLAADRGHDIARTEVVATHSADPAAVNQIYVELCAAVRARLEAEGAPGNQIELLRTVDMRYARQLHELALPVSDRPMNGEDVRALEIAFHERHLAEFAYECRDEHTELVTFRVRGVWRLRRPELKRIGPRRLEDACKKRRGVYFREPPGWVECPVYERELLGHGCDITGPAIIEEMTSATLVPPGFTASIDAYANIHLRTPP